MGSFVEDGIHDAKSLETEKKQQTDIHVEGDEKDEKFNDNPIEEVRLTVPTTDDPLLPALTFRTWVLGIISWPFNIKEHVLITIFAGCGSSGVYAVGIITIVKAFYERPMSAVAAMLLVQTTQLLGYGWAGLFRKYLVDSPYMWWPSNLVQVSLFRALHEVEKRTKGGLSRLQFFLLVFISSFVYYTVPGYLFPTLSALSFVCLIWKDSITAQKIGSGLQGLGIGSLGLDWSTVAYMGSPLASPFFAIANYLVGKVYLSIVFAFIYGLSFATLMASLSHVALFEGKKIWEMWKQTTSAVKDQFGDVHTRLMKNNYKAASIDSFNFHGGGIVLACGMAFFFTLPVGVIQATTNMQPGLNVITELIIGYMYPAWWLLTSVDHICNKHLLPKGSPWTCPNDLVFYNASIIWGVVGPLRMFTSHGIYPQMNWFFLIGVLAPVPVWLLSRKFPEKKWIKYIHMPLILAGPGGLPSAKAVHYWSWAAVGIFFNYYIFKRYKGWWARHNYILSAALDAGLAFMGVLLYFALQSHDVDGPEWWGLDNRRPLSIGKLPYSTRD
ncbi:hypothetical protein Patl1_03872 [Pistacia atlantica]|uniref:Uncharacterized protein n=1 Tax=Pistacia atlantica TaxID=434234 RepID=A0ACC1BQA6_9ROSI|nr:hypothetical protein Patl1_03872 [Pistacia atlantica]